MLQLSEIKSDNSSLFSNTDSYVRFLISQKGRNFFCCPYPGNPGDNLICKGTEKLLADLWIQTINNPKAADILLYPGGCPTMWTAVLEQIEEAIKNFPDKKIVIGPATFEYGFTNWPEIFSRHSDSIAGLFCRDKKSFENLKNARLSEKIIQGLSHDPALYLKDSKFIQELKTKTAEEYVLAALRRDHEMMPCRTEKIIDRIGPLIGNKYSKKLIRWIRKKAKNQKVKMIEKNAENLPVKVCDVWLMDEQQYLETICSAEEIHTDRLHVMILSAMLGKKVFAYPTLYGKLENVYEHSLKNWANVEFISKW